MIRSEVIFAGDLIEDHTGGPDGGFYQLNPTDATPYRYVNNEIIGWEAVREQLMDLLIKWSWLPCDLFVRQSGFVAAFEYIPQLSITAQYFIKIFQEEMRVRTVGKRVFAMRFTPQSINDLKAILRAIDPVLVGEG